MPEATALRTVPQPKLKSVNVDNKCPIVKFVQWRGSKNVSNNNLSSSFFTRIWLFPFREMTPTTKVDLASDDRDDEAKIVESWQLAQHELYEPF